MPSEEGPAQKYQRQSEDPATIGDIVDFDDIRMFDSADKDQPLFDTQQSVRSCALIPAYCPEFFEMKFPLHCEDIIEDIIVNIL